LLILIFGEESILGGHENTWDHRVLNKASDGFSTGWNYILPMGCHKLIGLRTGQVALTQVQIHLISIKVSIISVAVSIMHSDRLFFG
jgi:hypothetical protein